MEPRAIRRTLTHVVVVAAAYFAAGRLALLMAIPPGYATAVWPATGVALVGVLAWGYRVSPGIAIGSFLVNVGTSFDASTASTILRSIAVAASIGVGASLQGIATALLVRRLVGYPSSLDRAGNVARFLVLAGPAGCVIGASWGVTTLVVAGIVPADSYGFSWWTWWVGDAIGAVIFTPLLLAFVGEPRFAWRRRRHTVAAPLAVGFAAVTVLFVLASRHENARLRDEFGRRAGVVARALERRMEQYLEVGASVASLWDADPQIARDGFLAFTEHALARHPEIQALSWIARIPRAERAAYEAAARSRGHDGFAIRELASTGELVPAGERDEYFPIVYIAPAGINDQALGFDLESDPRRHAALVGARDTGAFRATAPITLVQDASGERGFLVVMPVYAAGAPRGTVARRRASLAGFSSTVLRARDVVVAALLGVDRHGMVVELVDDDAPSGDGLLYRDEPEPIGAGGWTTTLEIAGRRWRLDVVPTAALVAERRSWQAWTVLAGGLVLVGLLGAVLLIVTGREARVIESERRTIAIVTTAFDGIVSMDAAGRVLELNPAGERMFGRPRRQVVGTMLVDALVPGATQVLARDDLFGSLHELRALRADGSQFPVEVAIGQVRDQSPLLFNGFVRDISERKRAEAEREGLVDELRRLGQELEDRVAARTRELMASLKEKEVLLREIHHRVKNNLQIVSSLLGLQARRLPDASARAMFAETTGRVHSIALVHERLYQSKDLSHVDFDDYVRSLVESLFHAQGAAARGIASQIEVADVRLAVDAAIPSGLVIHELVTNSLKHAFPGGRTGRVRVSMMTRLDQHELAVDDDGVGFPLDLDPRRAQSLGLELVFGLAEQLGAEVEIQRERGTRILLRFRAE